MVKHWSGSVSWWDELMSVSKDYGFGDYCIDFSDVAEEDAKALLAFMKKRLGERGWKSIGERPATPQEAKLLFETGAIDADTFDKWKAKNIQ